MEDYPQLCESRCQDFDTCSEWCDEIKQLIAPTASKKVNDWLAMVRMLDIESGDDVELWDIIGMTSTIDSLLEWGFGSGEEFYHWLTEDGSLPAWQAKHIISMLQVASVNANLKHENLFFTSTISS